MLIDHLIDYLSNERNFFEMAFNSIRNPSSAIHEDFIKVLVKGANSIEDIKHGIERDPEMLMILLEVNIHSSDKINSFRRIILPKENLSEEL